jgi:hypothetical protein
MLTECPSLSFEVSILYHPLANTFLLSEVKAFFNDQSVRDKFVEVTAEVLSFFNVYQRDFLIKEMPLFRYFQVKMFHMFCIERPFCFISH